MPEATRNCPRCGGLNEASTKFCTQCGADLQGPSASAFVQSNPVFAAQAPLTTAVVPIHYGGFWIRFVAAIIDGLVVQVFVLPLGFFIGLAIGVAGAVVRMPGVGIHLVGVIVGAALGFVGSWLYEAAMESSSKQATLGKMALSLKVTDLEGRRISFGRATGRHFAKYLSGMILFVGYIMAGFTERKQALHDMVAGTLVRYN